MTNQLLSSFIIASCLAPQKGGYDELDFDLQVSGFCGFPLLDRANSSRGRGDHAVHTVR